MIFYGIFKKKRILQHLGPGSDFDPSPPTLVLARPLAMVDVEVTITMDPLVALPAWPRIQPQIPHGCHVCLLFCIGWKNDGKISEGLEVASKIL